MARQAPRVLAVVLLLVAAIAAAGGGYALGQSGGEDLDDARAAGATAGKREGLERGRAAGEKAGERRGRREGFSASYKPAYQAAYKRGSGGGATEAPPPSGQPADCGPGLVSASNGCVPESEAKCAAYQDFVPARAVSRRSSRARPRPSRTAHLDRSPSGPRGRAPSHEREPPSHSSGWPSWWRWPGSASPATP